MNIIQSDFRQPPAAFTALGERGNYALSTR
jgi:hypothetical protein